LFLVTFQRRFDLELAIPARFLGIEHMGFVE
jgi:hypothetical protein